MLVGRNALAALERIGIRGINALLIIAAGVGLVTGLGAIGFTALIRYFNRLFFGMTDQLLSSALGGAGFHYWTPVIPMLGGLIVGPIVFHFAKEAKGHGVPEVMNSVARLGGIIRPRVALAKAVASAICIGSGGSAGREGPIVQIGSALGSSVAQFFGLSSDHIKLLVGCGAAAGISAIFNAPIAGVFFSLEVILGDFAIGTFSPVLISSVLASVLTRSILGNHPAFSITPYELVSGWEIPMYIGMGAVLGAIAVLFTKTLDYSEDVFEKLRIPSIVKPALGGLLLGIVAFLYPQVLADGYETIRLTLHNNMALALLIPLIFLKIAATSLTLGSGSSGGIFAPSLFIGAMAGGAFGFIAQALLPGVTADPGAYALVGMAGVVAGTTHAPITALMIIFEMTGDYRIILPLMLTVAVSSLVARSIFTHSIYTIKLFKRGIDLRSGRDINILRAFPVSEIMDQEFAAVPASTSVDELLAILEQAVQNEIVVIDGAGNMHGMASMSNLRSILAYRDLGKVIVAGDVVTGETPFVFDTDNLEDALAKLNLTGSQVLPVLLHGDRKPLGLLRRHVLLEFYNRQLLEQMR
ncbi:MAG: chloride channel protein [Candidatus Zixiibacteriota bacterium]